MTEDQKRNLIAGECGWMFNHIRNGAMYYVPAIDAHVGNPFHDLNACHEFEKTLTQFERSIYRDLLPSPFPGEPSAYWHATAAQRAEAFGRVKGLWR